MAHLEKYTRKAIMKISKEAYREHKNKEAYRNNVDLSKTHLNYSMENFSREDFLIKLDKRCSEVMGERKMQSQTAVVGSWVFTAPKEILGNKEKEREYFRNCYEFCKERYGCANIIDGIVHYDESTPHMTVAVVPVTASRKTGRITISSASLFTLKEMRAYHDDLEIYLFERMHIKGLGKNGRTKGNYTIDELKERSKQEKEAEELTKKQQKLINEIFYLQDYNDSLQKTKNALKQEVEKMLKENKIQDEFNKKIDFLLTYDRYVKKQGKWRKVNAFQVFEKLRKSRADLDIDCFMKKYKFFKLVSLLPEKYVPCNCFEDYRKNCERKATNDGESSRQFEYRKLPDISDIIDIDDYDEQYTK